MIRIRRSQCPSCLVGAGNEGDTFRAKAVVRELWKMQYRKCCYSETLIPDKGHGKAVEHFRPKSVFKSQRNDWNNLLLVCAQCNGRKRALFPTMLADCDGVPNIVYLLTPSGAEPAIIDPSAKDPEKDLTYELDDRSELYGQIIPRENSKCGEVTIEVTGLDDDVFFRERFSRLNDILEVHYRDLLRAKKNENEEAVKGQVQSFRSFVSATAPFAGLAREFARQKGLDHRFGLEIPTGATK